MKKRLRFQMPHVPLKVLRGRQDEEDIQDQLFERFQAPPGTSTEEEAERAAADGAAYDSRTSHSSHEDITTDASNEGMERYDTTGSINQEAADVNVVAQVHRLPSTDVTSNDDTAPLLSNIQ